MSTFPTWTELHRLVVHFPIAPLLVVPIFLVSSLFRRSNARAFALCAFALLVVGTGAAMAAVQTGEAADRALRVTGIARKLLERHEHLSEITQFIFIGLTLSFGLLYFLPTLAFTTDLVTRRPDGVERSAFSGVSHWRRLLSGRRPRRRLAHTRTNCTAGACTPNI